MSKKIITFLSFIIFVFLLVSCDTNVPKNDKENNSNNTKNITKNIPKNTNETNINNEEETTNPKPKNDKKNDEDNSLNIKEVVHPADVDNTEHVKNNQNLLSDYKKYVIKAQFNEDNTYSLLLNEDLLKIKNFKNIKKINFYDNNLYTLNYYPNDTIYYKLVKDEYKVYIKPAIYEYDYTPYKYEVEYFSTKDKTNYNFSSNFFINENNYKFYKVENDYFLNNNLKYYKDFYIIKNFENDNKYYSFIKLYHTWNIFDINKLNSSNPFEKDEKNIYYETDDIWKPGKSGFYRSDYFHTYMYINEEKFYANWYYYDYDKGKSYTLDHIINYNLKEFLNKRYKNTYAINKDLKYGDILVVKLHYDLTIEDINIYNLDWEELKYTDIIEKNDDSIVYLKNNKKYILNKNTKLNTYTETPKIELYYKYFKEHFNTKIDLENEDIKSTFYVYFVKTEKENEYLIKEIFTFNDKEMIKSLTNDIKE